MKRYRYRILGISIFLLLLTPASAQQASKQALNQIMSLFAGRWVGQGTSPEGGEFVTELNFEWTLNKKFIKVRNTIESDGKSYLYAEATYGWHPVLKKILFWSFDNEGGISEGTVSIFEDAMHHDWRSFRGTGEIREWRSELKLVGEDKAQFTLLQPEEGEWQTAFSIEYVRTKSK